ncbi:hypothetical protein Taro_005291 [Colocasia esculenta]|uniref:Uncharacterized protein n=1 Tax=Colocasia esculenta TaxID=4460 RepID=A0A843TXF5_COLES|nr:hypothetical protein [Colocasia esculenta]
MCPGSRTPAAVGQWLAVPVRFNLQRSKQALYGLHVLSRQRRGDRSVGMLAWRCTRTTRLKYLVWQNREVDEHRWFLVDVRHSVLVHRHQLAGSPPGAARQSAQATRGEGHSGAPERDPHSTSGVQWQRQLQLRLRRTGAWEGGSLGRGDRGPPDVDAGRVAKVVLCEGGAPPGRAKERRKNLARVGLPRRGRWTRPVQRRRWGVRRPAALYAGEEVGCASRGEEVAGAALALGSGDANDDVRHRVADDDAGPYAGARRSRTTSAGREEVSTATGGVVPLRCPRRCSAERQVSRGGWGEETKTRRTPKKKSTISDTKLMRHSGLGGRRNQKTGRGEVWRKKEKGLGFHPGESTPPKEKTKGCAPKLSSNLH